MLAYPCRLTAASEWNPNDTGFVVTCRDVEGAVTQGETVEAARAMAQDAIATLLSSMKGVAAWPAPTPPEPGEVVVALPPRLVAKAALWATMNERGLSRSDLARQLGVDEKEARRLLSFGHGSRMDRLEAALRALGKQLVVDVREAA
jgi:antitoxin HicB